MLFRSECDCAPLRRRPCDLRQCRCEGSAPWDQSLATGRRDGGHREARSKSVVRRQVPRSQRRCAACLALGGVCVPARSDGKALAPARSAAREPSTARRGRHPLAEAVLAESLTLLRLMGSLHLDSSVLVVPSAGRPKCRLYPRGCFLSGVFGAAGWAEPRGRVSLRLRKVSIGTL